MLGWGADNNIPPDRAQGLRALVSQRRDENHLVRAYVTFSMEGGGARPAALSAAVLGSRNARRQVQAAMAHAAEYGAYSVGFSLGRGCLTGFTIYLAGNFAGCGAGRAPQGMAATCAVQPPTARDRAAGHAQPKARAAASRGQRPAVPCDEHAVQPQDAVLPHCAAQPQDAPKRTRGCRAGQRRRARRAKGSRVSAVVAAAAASF